jgi:hypothetical protein
MIKMKTETKINKAMALLSTTEQLGIDDSYKK